jgi:hypothetical protein
MVLFSVLHRHHQMTNKHQHYKKQKKKIAAYSENGQKKNKEQWQNTADQH